MKALCSWFAQRRRNALRVEICDCTCPLCVLERQVVELETTSHPEYAQSTPTDNHNKSKSEFWGLLAVVLLIWMAMLGMLLLPKIV